MAVLYLSYNGLMEPIGQSQILPYLRRLAPGRRITLVTYEKSRDLDDRTRRAHYQTAVEAAGIRWIPLRYHKSPAAVSTAYDLTIGFMVCAFVCLRERPMVLHARSLVPALMALMLKRTFGGRLIYDTRGFWIDERLQWGLFRQGSVALRMARWFEARILEQADAIFVLSEAAADAIRQRPAVARHPGRVHVATTCADLEVFRPALEQQESARTRPLTIGYVGTAGHGYLFEPVLDLFVAFRTHVPDARLKIVNRADHALIRKHMEARGLSGNSVEIIGCDHGEVPAHMREMDVGVFFYGWPDALVPPVFTRMGEFLGCGVPCVSNVQGLGTTEILGKQRVGLIVKNFDELSLGRAASEVMALLRDTGLRQRCVEAAREHFSLEGGLVKYEAVYRQLESASHGH